MCGIAGIVQSPRLSLADLGDRLQVMRDTMIHRGPDDAGMYISPDRRVGLANRRLAIRDLSPAGHMPMSNDTGMVWITYNGEIYNTDELRLELERVGGAFHSTSDTEVILRGYEAWGDEVVQRLRGMFAFAILDLRRSTRVFLARDRMGVKPLYYAQTDDGVFLFASELKAMQASGLLSREISPVGLVGYLMLGAVPNPWTIYRDIQAMPPACTLTWQDGRTQIQRYWELPTDVVEPPSYAAAVEQVRALLEESVRIRLVSDVPLGAFLSGGLDSSSVTALMRKTTNGPIRTCSMIFEEARFSEMRYARSVAQAVGSEHYERVITVQDLINDLDGIIWAMDQPSADGVNTYFVSKTAREAGLTVALSGLGGDELFGGYQTTFQGVYPAAKTLSLIQSVPGAASLVRATIPILTQKCGWIRVADALQHPVSFASAYLVRRGLFASSQVRALSPELWHAAAESLMPMGYIADRSNGRSDRLSSFAWVSRAELRNYTLNQLLRDTDVMSMAHSLEVRVPLLDHRLVELVLQLPEATKRRGKKPKSLLLNAMTDCLPEIVKERVEKQGFVFPFDCWLGSGLLKPIAEQVFGSEILAKGLLRRGEVQKWWQMYMSGKVDWYRIWALMVLCLWEDVNHGS